MAKNRRRHRRFSQSVMGLVPKPVGIGFVVLVSLALVYLWIGHKSSQYSEEIKRLEDQCAELDNEKVREETKWNGMKTADQLDALLVRNGLLMVYPNAAQIVRVSGASCRQPAGVPVQTAGPDAARGATRVAAGRTGR
ncbi:MAG: hypothetical protein ACOYOU_06705 [Kiritimatiellia bacterium]